MSEPEMDTPATRAGMDAPPAIELEGVPTWPATPGARLRMLALAALVCLVAGGVLAHEIGQAPPRTALAPTAAGPVVLLSNVSYGAVTLNGRRMAGSPPLVLPLADGWNRLSYAAAPFTAQTCRVQWSEQGWVNGDCLATGPEYAASIVVNGLVVRPSLVIVFRLAGGDLAPALYATARALMASQLAAVSGFARAVPAGEPIAVGGRWPDDIRFLPAGAGVRAAMSFGLYDDTSDDPHPAKCDLALCAGSLFFTTASASLALAWNVAPDAYYIWRFADGGGNVGVSLPYPVSPNVTVPLTYDVTLGWQSLPGRVNNGYPPPMAVLLDGTFCDAGVYALNALTQQLGAVATVMGNSGFEGCIIALRTQQLQPLGRFIWRWGVLLAADLDAHIHLPDLPVASPSEIAALSG